MILYVETSAAAKLLVDEPASSRLAVRLDDAVDADDAILSSTLLETELRRLALRAEFAQSTVTQLLARFDLVEIDRSLYREAGLLPGRHLRSLGALHLAAARRRHHGDLRPPAGRRSSLRRVASPRAIAGKGRMPQGDLLLRLGQGMGHAGVKRRR
ncbi:MAG: PIN domain-containing protein [Pseudonocardiaceae bacterium]